MYIRQGQLTRKHHGTTSLFDAGKVYLFGQKTRAVEYHFEKGDFEAYGYKLRPGGLFSLFNISADELTDGFIELNSDMYQSALETDSAIKILPEKNTPPDILKTILAEIHTQKGDINLGTLIAKFKIGYKQIERLFRRHIGLTPKLYARILRFNNSLKLHNHPIYNLTDIAYQSGYFDQNHFIKEAKIFTGHTPSKLLRSTQIRLENNQMTYLRNRAF